MIDNNGCLDFNLHAGQLLWNRWAEEFVVLYDDSTMAWFTVSIISLNFNFTNGKKGSSINEMEADLLIYSMSQSQTKNLGAIHVSVNPTDIHAGFDKRSSRHLTMHVCVFQNVSFTFVNIFIWTSVKASGNSHQ